MGRALLLNPGMLREEIAAQCSCLCFSSSYGQSRCVVLPGWEWGRVKKAGSILEPRELRDGRAFSDELVVL